jgi:hypothetical protein
MDSFTSLSRKLVAACGIAFALLFFFGVAMIDVPTAAGDQEVAAWWADSGNRSSSIVSMYCFVLASLLVLVLLAYLRTRLVSAVAETALLSRLMAWSGLMFAVLLAASGVSRGVIASAVAYNDESLPGADTLRFVPQFSYGFTNVALLAAAVTMVTMAALVLRTAIFGRWLAWLSIATALLVAVVTVAAGRPFAIPAVLLWALATSVAVWRDREAPARSRSAGEGLVRSAAKGENPA